MNLQPIDYTTTQITALFEPLKGWEAKYRQLMLLGKQMPAQDLALRQEQYRVKGCESQVWLYHQQQGDKITFYADSDARIVKGLLVIILASYNGLTKTQVQAFNIESYFDQLDLLKHLSPSRSNGVIAIIEQIRLLSQSS